MATGPTSRPPAGSGPAGGSPISIPQFSAHIAENFPEIEHQCLLFELSGFFIEKAFRTKASVAATRAAGDPNAQEGQLPASRNQAVIPTQTGLPYSVSQKAMPVRQLGARNGDKRFKSLRGNKNYTSNLNYINYLSNYKKFIESKSTPFFNLTENDLARLQHKIQISESLIDKKNPRKKILNRILNNSSAAQDFADYDKFLSTGRRTGAGVEKVTVNYEGIDSATRNIVMVEATYIFQDIREMMSSKYSTLFTLDTTKKVNNREYRKFIEFEIGWNSVKDFKIAGQPVDLSTLDLKLRTHLVKYTFDLKRDGSIVVNATYRGSFIETLSGPKSNILELAKKAFEQVRARTKEIQDQATKNSDTSSATLKDEEFRNYVFQLLLKELSTILAKVTDETIHTTVGSKPLTIRPNTKIAESTYIKALFEPAQQKVASIVAGDTSIEIKNRRTRAIAIANKVRGATISIEFGGAGGSPVPAIDLAVEQVAFTEKQLLKTQENLDILRGNINNALQNAIDANIKEANLAKLAALREISENMIRSSKVYYLVVQKKQVEQFQLASSTNDQINIRKAIDAITKMSENGGNQYLFDEAQFQEMIRGGAAGTPLESDLDHENYQIIPFVFYGQFIESVLRTPTDFQTGQADPNTGYPIPDPKSSVYNEMRENGDDVRVDFGFLSFKTPYTSRANVDFPIYYIPISVNSIQNFFNREIISKGLDFYTISSLLKDVNSKLLSGVFNACAKQSNTQGFVPPNLQIYNASKDERKKKNIDQYFIYDSKNTVSDLKRISTNKAITPKTFGNYASNILGGIPHFFFLGKDRGILKNMSLSDMADEIVKSAIYYNNKTSLVNSVSGNSNSRKTGLPPAVFTANIDTIGFPILTLGQLIYIDLKPGFVEEMGDIARTFKATGYYSIYKIIHEITAETFSTNISANIQLPYVDRKILNSSEFNYSSKPGSRFDKEVSKLTTAGSGTYDPAALNKLQKKREELKQISEKYDNRRDKINLIEHTQKIKKHIKDNKALEKAIQERRAQEEAVADRRWWTRLADYSLFDF